MSRIRQAATHIAAEVRRDCSLLFLKLKHPWSLLVFALWNIGIAGSQMGIGVLTFELSAAALRHESRRMIVFPLGLPQALGFAFSAKGGSYVLLGNFAAFCGLGFYHLLHWFTRFALFKSILVVVVAVLQTLEVFVCGYMVRRSLCSRFKKVPCIDSLKDAFYYFGIVLAVSVPFEAAITLFQCLSSIVSWSDFVLHWGTWSMGVIAAMLTVSPVIIHAFVWRPELTPFRLSKLVEVLLVGVVTVGLLVLVYTFNFHAYIKPLPYLLFPVIVHAGFRFNRVGWAFVLCVISLFCTWATAERKGALYEISGSQYVDPRLIVQMQLFVSVTAGVGVSLAAAVREKKLLARKLERLNEKLESLVYQKTHQLLRANEELKASQRAAELASKSKSEFLANMSHEIRTPIHGIMGMATLILGTELTDEQKDSMNTLRECTDLLLHIINSILDLAKIEAGRFEVEKADLNLHRIVRNTMLMLAPRTKQRGLPLRLEIEEDVPEFVVGDSGKVQQCLLNLVGNAIKFTHEGSVTVQICLQESGTMACPVLSKIDTINWPEEEEGITELSKTRNLYNPRHTNIPTATSDPAPPVHVLFKITDTGIGISKEKLQEIFKPFTQADASISRLYGGTGLGLSIVQRCLLLLTISGLTSADLKRNLPQELC